MPTQAKPTPEPTQAPADPTDQGATKNPVVVFIITAILIALGLFLYIFTHGTQVPYLGPIGG